ncbi:uncharacterized protein LY79DRAFT_681015, partial [Colletotrichum navitas]
RSLLFSSPSTGGARPPRSVRSSLLLPGDGRLRQCPPDAVRMAHSLIELEAMYLSMAIINRVHDAPIAMVKCDLEGWCRLGVDGYCLRCSNVQVSGLASGAGYVDFTPAEPQALRASCHIAAGTGTLYYTTVCAMGGYVAVLALLGPASLQAESVITATAAHCGPANGSGSSDRSGSAGVMTKTHSSGSSGSPQSVRRTLQPIFAYVTKDLYTMNLDRSLRPFKVGLSWSNYHVKPFSTTSSKSSISGELSTGLFAIDYIIIFVCFQ